MGIVLKIRKKETQIGVEMSHFTNELCGLCGCKIRETKDRGWYFCSKKTCQNAIVKKREEKNLSKVKN
jgi:hypothetical protein